MVCGVAVQKPRTTIHRKAQSDCEDEINADDHDGSLNSLDDKKVGRTSTCTTDGTVDIDVEDERTNESVTESDPKPKEISEGNSMLIDASEPDDGWILDSNLNSTSSVEKDRTCHVADKFWALGLQALRRTFPFQESIFTSTIPLNFLLGYVMYAWMLFLVPNAEQRGIGRSDAVFQTFCLDFTDFSPQPIFGRVSPN